MRIYKANMSIYFCRHVKTINNQKEILSGRAESDILPNQQLLFPYHINFDIILCSTSNRCRETILLLPQNIKQIHIVYTKALLERNLGILENLSRKYAIKTYPELFQDGKLDIEAKIKNGEGIIDVVKRITPIVKYAKKASKNNNVLICSHNQTLKIMYALLKGIPLTNDYWKNLNFGNGMITKIDHV